MKIDFEIKGLKETIKNLERMGSETPFVMAKSLTNMAQKIKKDVQDEMKKVFDRPTPYTLNSIYVKPATKSNLVAEVNINDRAKYLTPQVKGGERPLKRSERYLGKWWSPGAGAKLNQYGNIKPGTITQILSVLGRHPDKFSNTTVRSRKRNKKLPTLFMIRGTSKNLPPGVWQKQGTSVKPVLAFIKQPSYHIRLHFLTIARYSIMKHWKEILDKNMVEVTTKR